MIAFYLGSIPFGTNALVGPVEEGSERVNTFAEYAVTRGKPVLHEIGEELDIKPFDFFFSEEFCSPSAELAKLNARLRSEDAVAAHLRQRRLLEQTIRGREPFGNDQEKGSVGRHYSGGSINQPEGKPR